VRSKVYFHERQLRNGEEYCATDSKAQVLPARGDLDIARYDYVKLRGFEPELPVCFALVNSEKNGSAGRID